ncbi:hypothetical protein ACF3OH_04010 [Chryseomicrobium aureum]|uniref:hypothetical protein n=1 Tax=Chryseomicrobium aureum TaxID=1441723 RepID=UPI001957A83E|nr:hypothetical protein [Chryseomicrobium aureum]MBM7707379.1 hypothetical protein [Chryseomicrobium aureum]
MTVKLAYYKVHREIDFYYMQQKKETEEFIHLTEHGVSCEIRKYTWKQVHDISYKPFSSGEGLLYLHTFQGMFSYRVKDDPSQALRFAENYLEKYTR